MIHEVLFYLWHENFDLDRLKFNELGDFLHQSEKQLLERIVKIGSDYHRIALFCKFVNKPLNNPSITAESTREDSDFYKNCTSQYIRAFANGIDKVLDNYRNDLLKIENFYLENPQISLTYILSILEKYPTLFDTLKQLIEIVKTDNLNITQLFNRLRNLKNCGIDIISQSIGIIVKTINVVFYEYLCHWIIYGDLIENYNDFFIVDGKCYDENFLYPDQLEELSLSSSSSSSSIAEGKIQTKRPPPVQKFYIDWNLVPIFITKETTESILFMGRIVWILRNNPNSNDCINNNNNNNKKKEIWDGEHIDYYKKIQRLENEIFNQVTFQQIMEECRLKLTKYLWTIMLDEGDLKQHLQLIREYYTVGRGELFNQFIQIVEKHVKDLSGYNTNNLNNLFMETARKIYGDNDNSYQKFELILNKSESETSGTNPWSRLSLNFEIKWPLHIIFHPKSIELYNKLFNYLIKLKRTEIHLHKLWVIHIKNKQKINRRVWTLRQHLTFLVNNLQYYLQVDVIEAQFSILLKAVENANEFEDIIKVHHEFISNLLVKTFVLTPDEKHVHEDKYNLHQMPAVQFDVPTKVYNVITRLLELCDKFCYIAKSWNNNLSEPELKELKNFEERTNNIVESLLFILYSLQQKIRGQHLLQLLYQLDFNRYFSKTKPDFNLSATD